jgi:hypothetical protein
MKRSSLYVGFILVGSYLGERVRSASSSRASGAAARSEPANSPLQSCQERIALRVLSHLWALSVEYALEMAYNLLHRIRHTAG